MPDQERLDLFQIISGMVGGSGRIDVLEVLRHVDLDEGWTTLTEIVNNLQQMGKKPLRERVARHLSELIEDGWVQGRLITLSWYQYRLVREKEQLLKVLAEEADKQQHLQAAQAALASEAVASAAGYWSDS